MILCIQCAMEAAVQGKGYQGEPDATIEKHMARVHPDLAVTQARRKEIETILEARIASGHALMDPDQS